MALEREDDESSCCAVSVGLATSAIANVQTGMSPNPTGFILGIME